MYWKWHRPGVGQRGFFHAMNDTIVLQIAEIFAVPDQSSVKIRKLSMQQQDGTVDCGAFAVAFATVLFSK